MRKTGKRCVGKMKGDEVSKEGKQLLTHHIKHCSSELNSGCVYLLNLVPPYGCRFKSASSSHLDYSHIQSYQIVSCGTDSLSLLKLLVVFHVKYASF